MKTIKLTVSTPNGTFSRRTSREYKYVITSRGIEAATLERRRQLELARKIENYEYYADIASGALPVPSHGESLEWYQMEAARFPEVHKAIEKCYQTVAATYAKEEETGQGRVHGWRSRLDLAIAFRDEIVSKGFRNVTITEVK